MSEEQDIQKIIAKLEKEITESPKFNEEETKILKDLINWVRGMKTIGSFADWFRSIIIWVGVLVGAYIAIKNGIMDFVINTVKGV